MDLFDIRNQLNAGRSIFDIPMRTTFYARVSTEKDGQLNSLDAQVRYYGEFIRANRNWGFVPGYVDEGISGTSAVKRAAFMSMITDARLGKFDFVITKEISRFSRNTMDSIKYTQELLEAGVGVLFQSDNINTLYADSELRLTIMSSIAQDEVRKISERVRFGFKRAVDSGVVLGSNRIWGYVKDNGRLVIEPDEAEMVKRIFNLYAGGNMGIRGVCAWLAENGYKNTNGNAFSFSTIKGILSNPKYKGFYCGSKTVKYDYRRNGRKNIDSSEWVVYRDCEAVPPIVSEEVWDRANAILKTRGEKMSVGTGFQNKYAYSGKIICPEHNTPYYRTGYKYKNITKEAWQCRHYAEKGKAGCTSPIVYTAELDDVIRRMLNIDKTAITNDMLKMYDDINDQPKKSEAAIVEILKKKDKLLELSVKGKISDDEFEARNNSFNAEIMVLRGKAAAGHAVSGDNLREAVKRGLGFENGFNESITRCLINKIEVHKSAYKNTIYIEIIPNHQGSSLRFEIKRRRGEASACTGIDI
ncbi:MAG: recombinase family protein [Defluviitaleaceae bacterium]|nr:recombinase family protein [Defluviitaleaceae bacterium]MCL2837206.1 recombinase family protein [Defluviitaleaceae bacterium]